MSARVAGSPRNPLRIQFLALSLLVSSACAVNPATGERELSFIGEAREIEMGREAEAQITASLGLYDDPQLASYVERVGLELAAESERPNLPWTFRVLDDPTVNAFALPGGFIYVTRGILTHLTSEAQLAGVLGHEIGHVTARHSVSQMSRAQLTQLGLGVGMILVPELQEYGGLASAGMQLLFLKHGRDDENQADELGVRYMTRANYDPRRLADVMAMLDRTSGLQEGSGRVPEWLSTHPDPANRVEHIESRVAALNLDSSALRVASDPFLDRMDGVVFGVDPREGYFEENVFFHPQLRFRLAFPRGWANANMKQAVQSVAPDQDAVLLLTLDERSPGAALSAFSSQTGVRVTGRSDRTVNGLQMVLADFSVATEQGELAGRVAFVSHGGGTYRLLGYSTRSRWRAYAAVVEESLLSFAPETDPAVLAVEPARVDLVQVDAPLTLESFVERYPSSVGSEIVGLINQLSEGARFDAGVRAKRVVGGSRPPS